MTPARFAPRATDTLLRIALDAVVSAVIVAMIFVACIAFGGTP